MLLFAALVFAVARWRRTRRPRDLTWLVPLQLLWTNLHGGFLVGVAFLWGLSACAVLAAALPAVQQVDDGYSWRDAALVLLVTIACSMATLVNPYGTELRAHPPHRQHVAGA
jgi:hypothetical protein